MKTLCLFLLFHASLQLLCDKAQLTAHIGGEFIIACAYETNRFLFSKKYWCRGSSRNTCEIVADSERVHNTERTSVIDAGRRGLYVKVTNLQSEDTGVYWVGIEKIYADIMTPVSVAVTEVPVSKPKLWALTSLVDRPTCRGQPMTVRCGSAEGTDIHYVWYQHTQHEDVLLHQSSDLGLGCGIVDEHSDYYCIASNEISKEKSDVLSVHVLMPADISCIYVVHMPGQSGYLCVDRMSTTMATAPQKTTYQATMKNHLETSNQSFQTNQTDGGPFYNRAFMGAPLWYTLLRWGSLMSLLALLCTVIKCTKIGHKTRARRKRKTHLKQRPRLAQ